MDILNPKKFKRIVPVKLIDNHLIKLNDLTFEQKIQKRYSKSNNKTIETSYSTNSYQSNKSIDHNIKLVRNLSQKYIKLMDDLKNGSEIEGTVEEKKNDFPTRNPFSFKTNLNHHNYISKNKKVLFKKEERNSFALKILDKNLYMTIFNKTQPPKKVFNKIEIKKLVKLQKRFKGFAIREVEQKVRNLKVNNCILEVLCLIIAKSFDSALKRKLFKKLKGIYFDLFNINEEIYFKDKIEFKLPDKYYNLLDIHQINISDNSKVKKKEK